MFSISAGGGDDAGVDCCDSGSVPVMDEEAIFRTVKSLRGVEIERRERTRKRMHARGVPGAYRVV